jgi:hypothetical protein
MAKVPELVPDKEDYNVIYSYLEFQKLSALYNRHSLVLFADMQSRNHNKPLHFGGVGSAFLFAVPAHHLSNQHTVGSESEAETAKSGIILIYPETDA